ncbi:YheC/YheD family protein [Effusibacillus lacus]|uniref:ATP-grasp domain-containing protein n=1 Tax=Effusibacillus lacus TaxID=1348429 RepID=A0A292YEU8_9BACL|nr:YheC/YheD family protein [Effusibacillus lacus]TCS73501.1 YheC/D-like protein [Effusibacillus lacus]GAX92002.1 hypothetical protein EFBL_3693 [Effusibacillus lacus]
MEEQKADLGVLLDESQLKAALQESYGFEYLPFYVRTAKRAGVNVIFFTLPPSPLKTGRIRAYAWNSSTKSYQADTYTIPSVIHNRLIVSKANLRKIRGLLPKHAILYNGLTRFDKWEVHRLLSQNPDTLQYLPITEVFRSQKQVSHWLQQYDNVYLKPCNGSLGMGVIRLRQETDQLEVSHSNKGSSLHFEIPMDGFGGLQKSIRRRPYLIQEGISLLQISEQPVDFRVSVQKGAAGEWTVSGVVGKVGVPGAHATNLAVGGKAISATEILTTAFEKQKADQIYADMKEAALKIAKQLETIGPFMADFGLDLAVTMDGTIKFIEANGRDLRITFRDAKKPQMWRRTFQNPILYGVYLLGSNHAEQGSETAGTEKQDSSKGDGKWKKFRSAKR